MRSRTRTSRSRSPQESPPHGSVVRQRSRNHRRGATACQVCRSRKTKCDNARPTCRFCATQGLTCLYEDGAAVQLRPEPTNMMLLERLNYAVLLLEQEPSRAHLPTGRITPPEVAQVVHRSDFTGDGFSQLEISHEAACTISCESILSWPILQPLIAHPPAPATSLFLQPEHESELSSPGWAEDLGDPSSPRRTRYSTKPIRSALNEDNILPLCKKFQALIFPKNPFMTSQDFTRYVSNVSENGPGWDGPSCLVLLACALASIAKPFQSSEDPHNLVDNENIPLAEQVDEDAANSFFLAAKKRLGLLSVSLVAVQCYYFAGLFEKFSLKPLAAWELFHQAILKFQTGIWKRSTNHGEQEQNGSTKAPHFEQRLYWSCAKAEFELRVELQLPFTGVANFKYPESFHALSMPALDENNTSDPRLRLSASEEHSWLHYLAEISLRGIMNRIIDGLYREGTSKWLSDIRGLFHYAEASTEELLTWRLHLPPALSFDDHGPATNEYAFFLRSRYFICLEWVHRPFLYYVTSNSVETPLYTRSLPLAQQCVNYAALVIQAIAHPYRYGAIWFNMRRAFGAALLMLAAKQHGKVPLPIDGLVSISKAVQVLREWEEAAPDLRRCRNILCQLIDSSTNSPSVS